MHLWKPLLVRTRVSESNNINTALGRDRTREKSTRVTLISLCSRSEPKRRGTRWNSTTAERPTHALTTHRRKIRDPGWAEGLINRPGIPGAVRQAFPDILAQSTCVIHLGDAAGGAEHLSPVGATKRRSRRGLSEECPTPTRGRLNHGVKLFGRPDSRHAE